MNHHNYSKLKDMVACNLNCYIYGPTASGKTRAVKNIAVELGKPFYKKLLGNQSTEASILGYMDAGGRYVEGISFKPFTEGGILLFDEVDNGNPNTNLVINGLTDGEIAFPCGMREKHKDCVIIATANTIGTGATLEYCGRNRMDMALLNRFSFIDWKYDEKLESAIAEDEYKAYGGTDELRLKKLINDIRRFRVVIEKIKINHILSPRNTLFAARQLARGIPPTDILTSNILKTLSKDEMQRIITESKDIELINQVFDSYADFILKLPNDLKEVKFKELGIKITKKLKLENIDSVLEEGGKSDETKKSSTTGLIPGTPPF